MTISFDVTGDFNNTERWFKRMLKGDVFRVLDKYGQRGVEALSAATPIQTGRTASSWSYETTKSSGGYKIEWTNSNVNNGVPIAIILQTGHGTGTGGYVSGRDYINPAIRPIFDEIANAAWKEVTR